MKFPFKTAILAAVAAGSLALPAAAQAATVPVSFANNQSGVEVTGGSYSYIQSVYTLPQVGYPNNTTNLAVYLADGTQSVVLDMGQVNGVGTAYNATLQVQDPTPGLAPGFTTGYSDQNNGAYAPGDKIELALSYDATTGQMTYTVVDLTNVTIPVWSNQFTDLSQVFSTAFAGALFANDVYATPAGWTQPTAKTELAAGTHTLVLDSNGANVTGVSKVRTAAGGSNLGVKLTSVSTGSAGKNFTVYLLPPK